MAKAPRPALPAQWKRFVREYGMNLAYWYQPKGLAITVESVEARLRILKEFEGKGAWRDLQGDYIRRLQEDSVSAAEDKWEGGGAPLARMLKQVMAVLGLAWVDLDDQVEVTDAGNLFLASEDKAAVLARQALRYQFSNPAVSSKDHRAIRLHPVPFLVRLLQAVEGTLSAGEYRLFVAKARAISEVDEVADQIDAFRELTADQQAELIRQCDAYNIAGTRRGSIYKTIRLNQSYAYKMWTLSGLIEVSDHSLKLNRIRGEARTFIDDYAVNGTHIAFADEKEFLAWMGDPEALPNQQTALDVYVSRNDLEAAAAVKKSLGASTAELRSFKKMMINEKTLEDNIEKNIDELGKRIGLNLQLEGRQYPTTVGPIDLLGYDKKSGQYVVIELKRGRSADKVFGQLSRYMGWVRKNLAGGSDVIGVIVGSKIDDKLYAARDAHDTKVHLVEFESRMSISVV